jgi:hypothetical protein
MLSVCARHVCLWLIMFILSGYGPGNTAAQSKVEERHAFNHDIRSEIRVEHRQWNRNSETTISGTIENLTDGSLEIDVDPAFYLSSTTSVEMGDTYWAPADLLHDSPIATNTHSSGGIDGIEPRPIHLQFKNKNDKVEFRIDAQHLLWAKEISSVWPRSSLFSTVRSGDYDLQLLMETPGGRVESSKLKLSIDASKSPKR